MNSPNMTDEKVKEAVETVARAICVKMGQEPDDSAPTGMICGPNNEPLPWWCFYEEQAEAAVLALQAERDKLSAEVARLKAESLHNYNDATQLSGRLEASEAKLTALVEALDFKALANRFLNWPVPSSVRSDRCMTMTHAEYPHQRNGTSMMGPEEAEDMLRYLLSVVDPAQVRPDVAQVLGRIGDDLSRAYSTPLPDLSQEKQP